MSDPILNLVYLGASVLFILGIKGLTHPRTAVRGNFISALAMLAAVTATIIFGHPHGLPIVLAGLVVGALIGLILAVKVQMTQMPQMVALLNGFGGGASLLVAWSALIEKAATWAAAAQPTLPPPEMAVVGDLQMTIATTASGLIGAVTLWGSLVAFAKLEEIRRFNKPIFLPAHQLINFGLLLLAVLLGAWIVWQPQYGVWVYFLLIAVSSALGVTLVIPIGGADMPVVIALLNSYSGLAAAATGFVIDNNMLIIAGSLVGASGVILTRIMCKAMNRSLVNVLFGRLGPTAATASAEDVYGGRIKSTTPEEVAMLLEGARRVVVVPGYGMAVAQAQYAVRDLYQELEKRGTTVEFGIHPVAGRMPGHMNVLLAEVNIPYDRLKEMDEINSTFEQTDVVIVLGANDVVNPEARHNPDSPIAGMPILDVDKARTVVIIKRSLSPGFAGIPNPLFAMDNCLMLFGDGKKEVVALIEALKQQ
ncbi:MAG: NAD(P)(+) transhydrogenase (Re/Si-specific) subunit beta [Phycisphaerae bacterium]